MAEKMRTAASELDGEALRYCMVSWRERDGSVHSAGPLPRNRAQSLVEAYGQVFPHQAYWVAPIPSEIDALHVGRVSRRRNLPSHGQ
jgi:hypothetical protein